MNTNTTERQTRWGRSRVLGGGTGRLIAVSLVLGAALASAVGGIYIAVGHPSRPWVALAIFVVVMLPVSTALAWVVLVDRSTITGASKNAEKNVENNWFERAAMGAFGDLMLVIGLGTGVVAIFDLAVAPALLLGALWVLGSVDFGVRYLAIRKAEG